jgi:CO/xanthine dehydrogenase Mo-binding subunit
MTEMLNKELSRKAFLKGGGAMIVGYGALTGAASAATGNTPFAARGPQDFLPNLNTIDAWLAIRADNTVIVSHGEPEFAGTPTGILMLVAEELNMSMSQMVYASPETWLNATGGGGGSGGIATRSQQARAAAAYAKQELLKMASTSLGVPVASLSVTDGVVSGGGRSVTYGALIGGKNFNFTMPAGGSGSSQPTTMNLIPGAGITKPVKDYQIVGKVFPRIEIPGKVSGKYTYVQNVKIPGMWHARWVNPRGIGANTSQNHFPVSIDESSIKNIPGAQVVRVGNFVAVAAPKEYEAIQAAGQLKVTWKSDPKFGSKGSGNYWKWVRQTGDANAQSPARYTANVGNVDAALRTAAKTVSATYQHHYNGFVPIGPHAAVADVRMDQNRATVFVQGQSLQGVPPAIGELIGIPAANVRAIWYEGSSSYGGGMQGQAAEQAALVSKAIGKPVRLQWMRWDQHGWDSYGPAHLYDVKAGVDANGKIVATDWTSYGQAGTTINTTRELVGTASWAATPGVGGPNPSDTLYAHASVPTGSRRVLAKTQPLYQGSLKISALRAPNAPQSYFASEQMIDELAYAARMDPIAFRKLNIDGTTIAGARWLSVLDAATMTAGWKPKVAASDLKTGDVVTGRGFGFGLFASTQVGIVADVEVTKSTGKILVKHVYAAENNGITVGPDLVANQTVGAVIQGLSRAMHEAPRWNAERITSLDWVTYPILRFKDAPHVTVIRAQPGKYTVVPHGGGDVDLREGNTRSFNQGWLLTGVGEPGSAAIGPAVANAFFDATGVRIRQAPMTPAVARGVLKNAGK